MKNCPFCKASIEDNARFCIYCMSSLDDKRIIAPKSAKKTRKRYIALAAAAVIIIAVAVGALFAFLPKKQNSNDAVVPSSNADNTIQSTVSGTYSVTSTAQSKRGNTVETAVATEIVTNSKGGKIIVNAENGKPLTTDTSAKTSSQPQQTMNNVPDGTVSAIAQTPTAANRTNAANTTKHISTARATTKAQQTAAGNAVYIYRAAKYGDDYSVSYPTDNCVVITGISAKSSSGTYTIPETLGGKKVIAVMSRAFCGDDIRDSVKKVIVPATVKTIWNGAFSSCRNLTDIYFCGSSIYTDIAAFADESIRAGKLTIHCAYDCSDRNLRYYRNTAADYGAQYSEWNG